MTYDNKGCSSTGRNAIGVGGRDTGENIRPDGWMVDESWTDSHDSILPVTYDNNGCRSTGRDAVSAGGRNPALLTVRPAGRTGNESCTDSHDSILPVTYDNLGCRCTGRKPRLHAGVSTAWPPDGTGNESCTDSHDLILPVTYDNQGCGGSGLDAIGVGGGHAIVLTIGPPGPTSVRPANRTGYESCFDPHILILEPGSDIISPRYARRQT